MQVILRNLYIVNSKRFYIFFPKFWDKFCKWRNNWWRFYIDL